MSERMWHGIAAVGMFLLGVIAQRWSAPTRQVTAEHRDQGQAESQAKADVKRTADVLAMADDKAAESVTSREVRHPDGTVETHTTANRSFAWRRLQREQEKEEAKTEVKTVVQWRTETKVSLVEKLREPEWAIAVLGGFNLDVRAPVAAVHLDGRIAGPLHLTVQVQKTFSGDPLDGLIALIGVKLTW